MLAVSALIVLASCGTDDGLGQRFAVTGTVSYNGNPLEAGTISFVSEDLKKNIGASGTITNGSYSLSTGGDGDGAQVGKYKVTISSKDDIVSKAQAAFQKDSGRENGKFPPQYSAKAEAATKSLIPAGYGDTRTTPLSAEVRAQANTFEFKLSDAEAPPEPPKASAVGRGRGRKGS